MSKFVDAYVTATGAKVTVPEHYLTSPAFEGKYALTPSARAKATKPKRKRTKITRRESAPVETPAVTETEPIEPPAQGETYEGVTPDA